MAYWLLKSEPQVYGIEDLEREGRALWDGVRNYQARNYLMAMKEGDLCFFYHSGANPPGIAGLCRVVRTLLPDPTQFDPENPYYDPKATPAKPAGTRWRWPSWRNGPSSPWPSSKPSFPQTTPWCGGGTGFP